MKPTKITISFATTSGDRPPNGVEEAAHEYAVHQVNFDRNNKFSVIKQLAINSQSFTENEANSDAFLRGITRAERTAKASNKRLRGTVNWSA